MRVRKHQGERVMVVPEPINTVFSSIHTHRGKHALHMHAHANLHRP